MFNTIKEAMNTNLDPVVISESEFEYKGVTRKAIKVKKARGKRIYEVVQYENGKYSEGV